MPAAYSAQEMQLCLLLVGDTPDGRVSSNFALLWGRNAAKESLWPGLQALYTRRDACDVLLTYYQDQTDVVFDLINEKQHQRIDSIQAQRDNLTTEILRLEKIGRLSRGGATLPLTTVAPINPPLPTDPVPTVMDANAAQYAGSPYYDTDGLANFGGTDDD